MLCPDAFHVDVFPFLSCIETFALPSSDRRTLERSLSPGVLRLGVGGAHPTSDQGVWLLVVPHLHLVNLNGSLGLNNYESPPIHADFV